MSNPEEQRIAKEEEYWTTPRLLRFGLVFLGLCIVFFKRLEPDFAKVL